MFRMPFVFIIKRKGAAATAMGPGDARSCQSTVQPRSRQPTPRWAGRRERTQTKARPSSCLQRLETCAAIVQHVKKRRPRVSLVLLSVKGLLNSYPLATKGSEGLSLARVGSTRLS